MSPRWSYQSLGEPKREERKTREVMGAVESSWLQSDLRESDVFLPVLRLLRVSLRLETSLKLGGGPRKKTVTWQVCFKVRGGGHTHKSPKDSFNPTLFQLITVKCLRHMDSLNENVMF